MLRAEEMEREWKAKGDEPWIEFHSDGDCAEWAEWEWDANHEIPLFQDEPLYAEATELLKHWHRWDIYDRDVVIGGRYPRRKRRSSTGQKNDKSNG